jgi:hypothetical protein
LKARKKLGEILVEGGLLTQEQLEKALPYQKKKQDQAWSISGKGGHR